MGWSKKDDGLRLYFERKSKSYLLVDVSITNGSGNYDCIGELLIDNNPESPKLCTTSCSSMYLYTKCRRAAWDDMPQVWRDAIQAWIEGTPESHRGLHRI